MFCLSWSARATRNTSHDSWTRFHTHVVSFEKSPLQICRVSRRIWCLISAPVSRPCWNRKCVDTGEKHSCCATPIVHTATPLSILFGDVPCSQARRTYSCTAIGWRSMKLVSKHFDTPSYKSGPFIAFWFVWQLRCCTSTSSQFLMFLLIILYTDFLIFHCQLSVITSYLFSWNLICALYVQNIWIYWLWPKFPDSAWA